jgi:hypothetical protein
VSTAPPSATTALPALGQEITGRACAYPSSARCRPKRPDTTWPTPARPHQHSQRRSTHHSSAPSETPNIPLPGEQRSTDGSAHAVRRRDVLGGLIHEYHAVAA